MSDMSSNVTNGTNVNSWKSTIKPIEVTLYFVIGVIGIIGNLVIIIAIIRSGRLRRRFAPLMVLACADFSVGLTNVIAALYRIVMLSDGTSEDKITPWKCMSTKPYVSMYFFSEAVPTWMTLTVAMERFAAVYMPQRYASLKSKINNYCYIVLTLGLILPLASIINAKVKSQTETVKKMCYASKVVSELWSALVLIPGLMIGFATIVLAAAIGYKIYQLKRNGNDTQDKSEQMVTRLMMIIVVCSIFLVIIPQFIRLAVMPGMISLKPKSKTPLKKNIPDDIYDVVNPFMYILFCVNCSIKIIIYWFLSNQLKMAFKSVLMCKKQESDEVNAEAMSNL